MQFGHGTCLGAQSPKSKFRLPFCTVPNSTTGSQFEVCDNQITYSMRVQRVAITYNRPQPQKCQAKSLSIVLTTISDGGNMEIFKFPFQNIVNYMENLFVYTKLVFK